MKNGTPRGTGQSLSRCYGPPAASGKVGQAAELRVPGGVYGIEGNYTNFLSTFAVMRETNSSTGKEAA